jgi:hypothetical protein
MRQKELAELLRKGLSCKNVIESDNCFLEDIYGKYYVCALGALLVGKFGDGKTAYEAVEDEKYNGQKVGFPTDYLDIAIGLLDIDSTLAQAIDQHHMLGVPAEAIIQRLRQGTFPY